MVLTYQEAVDVAARALSKHWRDMHTNEALGYQKMLAAAALEAVGYADLLAEAGTTVALADYESACRNQARAEAEVEQLRAEQNEAIRWAESVGTERDALTATLARVKALAKDSRRHGSATGWHSQVHTVVKLDDLRAALHPEETDDE